jgi:DNA-directed RNA polymerase II subunit RPB2
MKDPNENYDVEPYFALIDLFFDSDPKRLVDHHMKSFTQFIEEIIPSVVQSKDNIISEKITENYVFRNRLVFENIGLRPPMLENTGVPLFPLDAIHRNISYSSEYKATVTQWHDATNIATGETVSKIIETENDVPIAKIPIMVGSDYCNLVTMPGIPNKHCKWDKGGYFIVNGSEKVVLSIASIIIRKPLVFPTKEQNSVIYSVQVQSRADHQIVGSTQRFKVKMKKDESLVLNIPMFREISIFILMRALGLESDEDIIDSILDVNKDGTMANQLLIALNAPSVKTMSKEEAINELVKSMVLSRAYTDTDPEVRLLQRKAHLQNILANNILPHVVSDTGDTQIDMLHKAYYIGYMIRKLLKVYVSRSGKGDDRDSLINKRIELSGEMLGSLFEQYFKKMLGDCSKAFKPKSVTDDFNPPSIITHIKPNAIEQGLRQALAKGEFGSQKRKGFAQLLSRYNILSSSGYMRRVLTPVSDTATNKMVGLRQLHNTHYGTFDPQQTPEGHKTGLLIDMSLMTSVTISLNDQTNIIKKYLRDQVETFGSFNKAEYHKYSKIFINGNCIGLVNNLYNIYTALRQKRFKGEIERTVSLALHYQEKELHIRTDGGRTYRPFLTVTNNQLNFKPDMLSDITSWDELMMKYPNIIEYIDKDEEMYCTIADFPTEVESSYNMMNKEPITSLEKLRKINRINRYSNNVFTRYTHCQFHPSMMLGVVSANIPFTNHNHSVRGIYQFSQMKQAFGIYMSDFKERIDNSYVLFYPQVPIVSPRTAKYTMTDIFPLGENVIVAIASYTGYNQEDSIIMNQSSIDKGMFRAHSYAKKKEHITKNTSSLQTSIFAKPEPNNVSGMKTANYDKLLDKGYPKEETIVKNGDIIIGMITPKPTADEDERPYHDSSVMYKSLIPGAIDRVFEGVDNDDYPVINIRVRSERVPMIGDKFVSRHGQKGTVGMKYRRCTMPYTESGLVPDIIINPNCMPKRMTIGQLIECFLSKYCTIKGIYGDATAFGGIDIQKINGMMIKEGYGAYCNETMYNGMTGQKMPVQIFIGPTYYERLKHMVGDKAQSRARGMKQALTHQATEGKVRGGGLRLGEMERDALCAHGISYFMKESSMEKADLYNVNICDICGLISQKIPGKRVYICKPCNNTTQITNVLLPYACKLLFQELQTINVLSRIRTTNSIN